MPFEIPELGKFVIQTYEANDLAYPVVVVARDPTIPGYVIPAALAACPDGRYSATHQFTDVVVTNLDNRVLWKYERLPGPWLDSVHYDKESDVLMVASRRRNVTANIVEGITRTTDTIVTVIESEAIDSAIAWEVKTVIPKAEAYDLASALTSTKTQPTRFPATLDTVTWVDTFTIIGFNQAFVRDTVPHFYKTFWVISATEPDISSYLDGRLALGTIYKLLGQNLGEVIYDAVDIFYPDIATTVSYPGSVPDLTTYLADWVAPNDPRCVDGSVVRSGNKFRWKIELEFIEFLTPIVGALVP